MGKLSDAPTKQALYMRKKRTEDASFKAKQLEGARKWRIRKAEDPDWAEAERKRAKGRYNPAAARESRLQKFYGLTAAQYEVMVSDRDGVCDICGKAPTGKGIAGKLVVDHDHATGRVRGLLCVPCNVRVGVVEHDLYEKILMYLNKETGRG